MKNIVKLSLIVAAIMTPILLHANVIFPSMLAIARLDAIFGWGLIAISIIIEFIALYLFIYRDWLKVAGVTLFVNAISAIGGAIGLIIFDMGYLALLSVLGLNNTAYPMVIVYYILFYFVIVLLNTFLEVPFVYIVFDKIPLKRLLGVIFGANALSVAIGLLGLGLYTYLYGVPTVRF